MLSAWPCADNSVNFNDGRLGVTVSGVRVLSFDDVFLKTGGLSSSRWDEGLIRSAQEFTVRGNLLHSEMHGTAGGMRVNS